MLPRVIQVYHLLLLTHMGDGSTKCECARLHTPSWPIVLQWVAEMQLPFYGDIGCSAVKEWKVDAGKQDLILVTELRDVFVEENGRVGRYVHDTPTVTVEGILNA